MWHGDGIPAIVLASGFSMNAKKSAGIVSVLRHNGDPRQPWSIREIDRLPTSHRLRWADIDGSGRKVVVNQPLTAANVDHPEDHAHTPLVFYRPGEWKRETISEQDEGVVHGIYIVDWDGDGRDDILTAGFTGIHLYKLGRWRALEPHGNRHRATPRRGPNADRATWPSAGWASGGFWRPSSHGTATRSPFIGKSAGAWQRHVIDDSLADGHTILTADLNGDGADEVVAGYRGKGVNVYYAQDCRRRASGPRLCSTTSIAGRGLRHRGLEWRRAPGYRLHWLGYRESEVVRELGPPLIAGDVPAIILK